MAIGVFGLQVAYRLKRLEVMSIDDTHGWFGGGFSPGPIRHSTVDRIDFSNDTGTANIRSPLSLGRAGPTATGNSNYGWFGGGATTVSVATVDRIDFSNDSTTASPRGPLSSAKYNLAATGNSNYGWFGGGFNSNFLNQTTTVDRIDFSNDSATASPRGPLSLARRALAATGNSNYGWFGGGNQYNQFFADPVFSRVDRIDFSNDSPAVSVRGPLSSEKSGVGAAGNSNYGWFGGGYLEPSIFYSTVDRIDFSNDSATASVRGLLSSARGYVAATGNSNYGWFGGGISAGTSLATVDRIDFSNDSVSASPRGPLSSARYNLAATSGQARSSSIRLQKAGNYGWFGGGSPTNNGTAISVVNRIDFSNDSSTASVRGPLSNIRYRHATTSNSNYGWSYAGGVNNTAEITTVDRIDFSNDLATASVRSLTRYYSIIGQFWSSGVGNSNYGWIAGGIPVLTSVDRIDYSNDSLVALPRGPLTIGSKKGAATGNSNYGWIAGGEPAGSPVPYTNYIGIERINFSNDSVSSVRGQLTVGRDKLAATGNSNYGWFSGGQLPDKSTIERINFSNDYVDALIRGTLLNARYSHAATGNSNYGWFGGGLPAPLALSTVERINFSNDLAAASPRGSLTPASGRTELAATSNNTR